MTEFDINKAIEEVSRLEKIQAQNELRANQIKDLEDKLNKKLESYGVTQENLEVKIKELEAIISERLTHIKNLDGN
jgi:hypothetical protein